MFDKILIANRGEIAVRVARTARRMGIGTVAVFSEADEFAPHVRACDEAAAIGPAPAKDSYLNGTRIIETAQRCGAQAIHPGYGFLSENADFAQAVEDAGLTFIGPTAETIRVMGSKSGAKDLMAKAGVPITPGYQGADQSIETFAREAKAIGYPVLLKATAGGGGKGMRLVDEPATLSDALLSAQREAISAFGDDRFLIEKYIETARHVEVQIFGDGAGNVVHIFERDCSVQRRHQKIIEEAPAPKLPHDVRSKLLNAGVEAGRAVAYRGAGTVEFLYDGASNVYFMEMNTRLQVEHPVSEMITGLDFVEWQFRIAAGEGLPLRQDQINADGHAFEARLYAENPSEDFAPSTGVISTLNLPNDHARIDSGVNEGDAVTPFYDPMIAKIITHGRDRHEALTRLETTLIDARIAGLQTNSAFLRRVSASPAFAAGDVSTRFLTDHEDAITAQTLSRPALWAAAFLWKRRQLAEAASADSYLQADGFRLNRPSSTLMWVEHDGDPAALRVFGGPDQFDACLEPRADAAARRRGEEAAAPINFSFRLNTYRDQKELRFVIDDISYIADVVPHLGGVRVFIDGDYGDVLFTAPLSGEAGRHSSEGSLKAPMPGVITALPAAIGASIEAGDALVIMEAMKMEHTIKAPHDGIIKGFRFKPGDQVNDGDLLVDFESAEQN